VALFVPVRYAAPIQIVGRKLYQDAVARENPDEMLAHFARNMGEHIALAGQVHPEHRPRQHLRHRSFRHDLLFFGHKES
jgi:hypothetical protein